MQCKFLICYGLHRKQKIITVLIFAVLINFSLFC